MKMNELRETPSAGLHGTMDKVAVRALALITMMLGLVVWASPCVFQTSTTDASATQIGWVQIDFGDAQISVPTAWWVTYNGGACGTTPPGLLVVHSPSYPAWCGNISYAEGTKKPAAPPSLVTLNPEIGSYPVLLTPPLLINGISVYVVRSSDPSTAIYLAPRLKVVITTSGPAGLQVLDTLAPSPRVAVLAATRRPPASPTSWRWHSFEGIRFATPPAWPVLRTSVAYACGTTSVALGGRLLVRGTKKQTIEPDRPVVDLDTDGSVYTGSCPFDEQEYAPGNGVDIDSGSALVPTPSPSYFGLTRSIKRNGLAVYVSPAEPFDILHLLVVVPGRAMPLGVSIGLAGNGMVARTILYSLRPAPTPVRGILTGVVWACQGVVTPHPPIVTVYVYRAKALVTSSHLRSGSRYRFALPPGKYTVTSPPNLPARTLEVTVTAGKTTQATIFNSCI